MKVSEVMSQKVGKLSLFASLVEASKVMRRQGVGCLPVVEGGAVVGVVTDRDIVWRAIAEGRNPYTTLVSAVMTPAPMWCYADEDLSKATQVMEDNNVRRLIVLDQTRKLVGILSIDDLAAQVSNDRLLGGICNRTAAA